MSNHRAKENGSYRLGWALLELGFSVLQHNDLHRQATPYKERLAAEFRETVDLT